MGAGRVGVREQVGSRGTLSGTGRATPTPPQRATGRAGRAVQHTTPDRSTPPASMAASCSSHGPTAAGPATAPPAASSSGGNAVCEKCDACDGKHSTDKCPWFKGKARDKHPDAKRASEKKMLGMQSGPVEVLRHGSARVVRQPGDGSCLFHSMCHGLKDGSSASSLRREVAAFISENPSLMISDSPLKDWVRHPPTASPLLPAVLIVCPALCPIFRCCGIRGPPWAPIPGKWRRGAFGVAASRWQRCPTCDASTSSCTSNQAVASSASAALRARALALEARRRMCASCTAVACTMMRSMQQSRDDHGVSPSSLGRRQAP